MCGFCWSAAMHLHSGDSSWFSSDAGSFRGRGHHGVLQVGGDRLRLCPITLTAECPPCAEQSNTVDHFSWLIPAVMLWVICSKSPAPAPETVSVFVRPQPCSLNTPSIVWPTPSVFVFAASENQSRVLRSYIAMRKTHLHGEHTCQEAGQEIQHVSPLIYGPFFFFFG